MIAAIGYIWESGSDPRTLFVALGTRGGDRLSGEIRLDTLVAGAEVAYLSGNLRLVVFGAGDGGVTELEAP